MRDLTPCPICGNNSSYKFNINNYSLYACGKCGHQFFYPLPNETKQFYEDYSYFFDGQKTVKNIRRDEDLPQYKTYLDRIKRVRNLAEFESFRLLDVGCGSGLFVRMCLSNHIHALGIDISYKGINVARSFGTHCFAQDFVADFDGKPHFDVITMFDLIEHVPNPAKFIHMAYSLLKSGGILFITTPRSDSIMCKIFKKKWHLYTPPRHLHLFSRNSLELLFVKNSFKDTKVFMTGQYTNIYYMLSKMLVVYGLEKYQNSVLLAFSFMKKININVNLY